MYGVRPSTVPFERASEESKPAGLVKCEDRVNRAASGLGNSLDELTDPVKLYTFSLPRPVFFALKPCFPKH